VSKTAAAAVFFWVTAVIAAQAQVPIPVGGEFQVHTYTAGPQMGQSVDLDADGDFVIVWHSQHDQSDYGVFGRRFNSSGTALATEFQVNTYTSGSQRTPAVAMNDAGAFIVTWESSRDGSFSGIFARRFNATGVAVGAEFQINSYTTDPQLAPDVAVDADGGFVAVWEGAGTGDSSYGVFGRRFNSSGTPLATQFRVNTTTAGAQRSAALEMDADGDFVVVWKSTHEGFGYGVFGQRFNSSGAPVGVVEFFVNTFVTGDQTYPTLGVDADGDFVVAWESRVQEAGTAGIFARRYDSTGTATGGEIQVSTYVTGDQERPAIAIDRDGDFVVAWASPQDGNSLGIFARRFKSPAIPSTGEIQVNTYVTGLQFSPAAAADDDGDFVVSWFSARDEGNGPFARRFNVLAGLDVDGNGQFLPLSDGLLVLRFGFGFTGATLITGAVGAGCTRCDSPSIVAYLESML
jgi:hypothetical protein